MLKFILLAAVMTEMVPKEWILSWLVLSENIINKILQGKPPTNWTPRRPRYIKDLSCHQVQHLH